MKNSKRFTAIVLTMALMFTVFSANSFAQEAQVSNNNGDYLKSVMDIIKQKYNGNITEYDLLKAAVKGMFGSLDQFSTFYEQSEFNSLTDSLGGAVEGVGVHIQMLEGYVTVLKTFLSSPAQRAGILSGDKIAEVNGESMAGKSLEDVVGRIKGPAGTKVKLGISRQVQKNIITLEVDRAKVDVPCVKYEVRGDVGYIHIETFNENANSGVLEALKLFDNKKISKVVLDLRNNPGGLVDQAVEVAKSFVPKGLITTLDFKDTSVQDVNYYSTLAETKYKLAVLVNENSASASEILTGAIKDTKAGVIIGTKTYGKAKVQSFIPILSAEAYNRLNKDNEKKIVDGIDVGNAYESDLLGWGKMTVGMYYTPNGDLIDLKGIEPNVKVNENITDGVPVNLIESLSVTVKPSLGTQYMEVYIAECILQLLEYEVDTPDYVLDKKTFAAIKKFQKDSKVGSYGVLDFTTQKLLNKELETLKAKQDAVYAKAVELLK